MRVLRHIRSHAVAYAALFFALGGTAYAAVNYVEAPPNGGSGGTAVKNVVQLSDGTFQTLIHVPGLGALDGGCVNGQAELSVLNGLSAKLDVFHNLEGTPERHTVPAGGGLGLPSVNNRTLVGQVQLANVPGGAARAAVLQVAVQERDSRCRFLVQSIHVVKPAG